ncbi:MAG: hypothetical protein EP332_04700 [Bacteroidetes bacterium]|nr:MAG: hypothetical protein EP332_04700 [Bacteroidota bacterium]
MLKGKSLKRVSIAMLGIMVMEMVSPMAAFALTGGPSQPEVQSFEPVGTTEMVDLFSGDFVYNIPLLDIEGFPINVAYHSGVGMDDEASWVGLGWNINPGVVNRNLRGLPDDFNGDQITKETHLKNDWTLGINFNPSVEIIGKNTEKVKAKNEFEKKNDGKPTPEDTANYAKKYKEIDKADYRNLNLGVKLGVYYNSYRGMGYEFGINSSFMSLAKNNNRFTAGLGGSFNSQGGMDVNGNIGLEREIEKNERTKTSNYSISGGYSSLAGLQSGINYSKDTKFKPKGSDDYRVTRANASTTFRVRNIYFHPTFQNSMRTFSASASFKWGGEMFGAAASYNASIYFNTQYLKEESLSRPGYGYLYSHLAQTSPQKLEAQLDFNRSNDGAYTKDKSYLPMTTQTYDAFMVAGEGTGGTFRAYRSDIGVVYDPLTNNVTGGIAPGFDFGAGNAAKVGFDLSADYGWSSTGKWMSNRKRGIEFNGLKNLDFIPLLDAVGNTIENYRYQQFALLGFNTSADTNNFKLYDYEPYYFKNAGDMSRTNEAFYNLRLADQAFMIPLHSKFGGQIRPDNKLIGTQSNSTFNSRIKQEDRQVRNQVISFLNAGEANVLGLEKCVSGYDHNSFSINPGSRYVSPSGYCMDRTNGVKPEAMSEVTVLNTDGRRYVYGLPAYNNVQQDVSFNVVNVDDPNSLVKDQGRGVVTYPVNANSTKNTFGENHFFQRTTVPKYAHSFLLTGILSADYVDVLEDGITYDDLGSAIKFNYTQAHSAYKWRMPFGGTQTRQASYNPGNRSDKWDDQGSYIYGEKEIWYVHSIESKNYVAFFYTSERADAHQVLGENGGIDTSASMYKLDSIALYTKQDLISGNNVPIKVVHFEYDYSLCPNVENNDGNAVTVGAVNINASKGKLTLKKIYFTYGKSRKGKISPYQFTYSDFNPEYNLQGYDRWGNYKAMPTSTEVNGLSIPGYRLSNNDDPYVLQNKDSVDKYVGAWHIKKIKLPSGGVINIEFESDDYAYVQNYKASRMFKVIGLNSTPTFASNSILYTNSGDTRNNFVFFELPFTVNSTVGSDSLQKLKNLLFDSWKEDLYFKFVVDVGNEQSDYEIITGFADVEESGFTCQSGGSCGNFDVGYVKLHEVSKNDKESADLNPISFAAMNYLRLNLPKKLQKLFGGYELAPGEANPFQSARNMIPAFKEFSKMFVNEYSRIIKKGACKNIVLNKSMIRLDNPTRVHFGGGNRVKKVTISDNWSELSGTGEDAVYGQEYDYTTTELVGDKPLVISSGVATYEPGIGNDENPMKRPSDLYTTNKRFLKVIPDDRAFDIRPVHEAYMPPASVGYSKVTSRNIKPSENIYRTGTGHTINEFYTAKDFPVRFEHTEIQREHPYDPIRNFLKVVSTERGYASQGYSVILNDMHGKPRAQSIYREGETKPFSEVKYEYYAENDSKTGRLKLVSTVPVLNKADGSIGTGIIGKDVDVTVDSRQQEGYHMNLGQQSNLDAFLAAIFPAAIPSFWPGFTSKRTDVGLLTTTKIVQEYGILKTTTVVENGASIDTKNILFDGETGNVIMTETQNEFGDPIFSYSIPAHYYYEGMSGAYKNIGYVFTNQYIEEGVVTLPNANSFLYPGDEVAFYINGKPVAVKGWVVKPSESSNQLLYVSRSGDPIHFGDGAKVTVKVIRSGRRNMQAMPIGTVVTLEQPSASTWDVPEEVINASAIEMSEDWSKPYHYIPAFRYRYNLPGGGYSGGGDCTPSIPCPDTCYDILQGKMSAGSNNPFLKGNASRSIDPTKYEPWYSCQRDAFDGCKMCFPYNWDEYFEAHPINKPAFIAMNTEPGSYPSFDELVTAPKQAEPFNILTDFASVESPSNHGPSAPMEFAPTAPVSKSSVASNTPDWSYEDLDLDLVDSTFWYQIGPCRYMSITLRLYCTISDPNAAYEVTRYTNSWDNDVCCRILSDLGAKFEYRYYDYCPTIPGTTPTPRPGSDSISCGFKYEDFVINPYTQGIKGNWRPKRSWVVLDERSQSSTSNVRKDGTYTLSSFWKKPTSGNLWRMDTTGKWVWSEKMTKYSRTGQNIETVNPLNIHSSAVYGYGDNLPMAVGSNLKLRQMAFDGAEDHPYILDLHHDHFSFRFGEGVEYSDTAHTGLRSLKVQGTSDSAYVIRVMRYCETETPSTGAVTDGYYPKPCDFSENFSPDTGLYYVSAWVRQNVTTPVTGYTGDSIKFYFYTDANKTNPPIVQWVKTTGKVIEGWQKIEGTIYVPAGVVCYAIVLKSGATGYTLFDDIRMFPYKANMRSFVYNPNNLRLMAELDENNYATFYEYDEEGRLIRIKRETERGIVTIKESRTGIRKTD